jgi:ABC-type glycerol-3-phosphate transport system substrate-binding protein
MRKIFTLMSVAALLIILAACGGGNGGTTDEAAQTPAAATGTPAGNTDMPATPGPGSDDNGYQNGADGENGAVTVNYTDLPQYERFPFDSEGNFCYELYVQKWDSFNAGGRTINIWNGWMRRPAPNEDSPEMTWMRYENLLRIEEKYNVNYVHTEVGTDNIWDLTLTSDMSGVAAADLVYFALNRVLPPCINGIALDYSQFAPPNADILNDQRFISNPANILGNGYIMVYNTEAYANGIYGRLLALNVDLIHEVGCEDPRDIYDANPNDWTWERFEEIAKDIKRASTPARELWALCGGHSDILQRLIASNGGRVYDDVNGILMIDSPQTIEAFNFYVKLLMDERVIFVFNENNVTNADGNAFWYQTGDVAMFDIVAWRIDTNTTHFEIGMVSYPRGPHFDGITFFRPAEGFIMPRYTDNPTLVYKFFEEYHSWWGEDSSIWELGWIDSYRNILETDADVRRLMDIGRNQFGFDLFLSHRGWLFHDMINDVFNNGSTVQQTIDERKLVIRDSILTDLGLQVAD